MKFKKAAVSVLLASMLLTACSGGEGVDVTDDGGKTQKKIVCLDAGHGVGDVGAVSPFVGDDGEDIYEKDINYALVLLIKKDLEEEGYEVVLPRGADDEEPICGQDADGKSGIVQRVKFANEKGYDLYISIHCNSFTDSSVSGTRLYYNTENNGKKNKKLADALSSAIEKKFSVEPRIYDNADLYAVTATKMPACLVEIGFITNREDLDKMLDESWRADFAESVASGVADYLK